MPASVPSHQAITRAGVSYPPNEWWTWHLGEAVGREIQTDLFPSVWKGDAGYHWEQDLGDLTKGYPIESSLFVASTVMLYLQLPTLRMRTAAWLDFFEFDPENHTPAPIFDHIFVSAKAGVRFLQDYGCSNVTWLPFGFDMTWFDPSTPPRDFDVGFVGVTSLSGHTKRRETIDFVASRYKMNDRSRPVFGREVFKTYQRSKMVVNCHIDRGINMRNFEAMGSGALLFAEKEGNEMRQLFQEGKHFVTYESTSDLGAKIDYYLKNEGEREAIARAGQEEVLSRHTYQHRAREILETCGNFAPGAGRSKNPDHWARAYAVFFHRSGRPDQLIRLLKRPGLSPSIRFMIMRRTLRALLGPIRKPCTI